MKKGKIIDITDYFEEGDESKKPKYIPQITNAKRDLNFLNSKLNLDVVYKEIDKSKNKHDKKWGGADTCIISPNDMKKFQNDPRGFNYIVTHFYKELSWLFIVITKLCHRNNLYDYLTKYHFYYLLAVRANKYIKKHNEKELKKNQIYSRKYVKNLFDEVLDEFDLYIHQLEKELISIN